MERPVEQAEEAEAQSGARSAEASGHVSRFVVGIDLGTTNVAVAYVDRMEGHGPRQLRIPQLISPGEVAPSSLLPSFCYLPGEHELAPGALELPWNREPSYAVGILARDQGAAVPERLVSSAKSWLAHAGVDRTRGILPWGSDLGSRMVSPVEVSGYYLEHIRNVWDEQFHSLGDAHGTPCRLREQQVVLTVPASFDEGARRLTLEAAERAGIDHVILLEEPLAAFYAWLWQQEETWQEQLAEGETVLVVDVGGGTTDFSLIRIERGFTLRRTAVGEHLLLGGDNMDMMLARQAEAQWGSALGTREWAMLCQQCRRAKEALLSPDAPDTYEIGLAGPGRSVVASTRTFRFDRERVLDGILTGFFPALSSDAPPPDRRRGIRQMGLPYAADPAVTGHLLQFLRNADPSAPPDRGAGPTAPSFLLFNGGAMLPECIREHVARCVGNWSRLEGPLPQLPAGDLNLAVSRGAAYYGLVRQGIGVRVKGGTARAYYLEVGAGKERRLVCVMPRDTDEGTVQHLEKPVFRLRANQPVEFPAFSSATRLGDRLGDMLTSRDDISPLPALRTFLKYGKQKQRGLAVTLSTRLNEVGTLDVWCATADDSHRYPLSFDLRGDAREPRGGRVEQTLDEHTIAAAKDLMVGSFRGGRELNRIAANLEHCLGLPRREWSGVLCRTLGDVLLAAVELREATSRHEFRWLNLAGFLARPGFGIPADEWRVRELWKLWHRGPIHPRDAQAAAEWWVLWRRVAGGLRSGQQQQIAAGLLKELLPEPDAKLSPPKGKQQENVEKWRCLGALERLSIKTKTRILRTLVLGGYRLRDHHFWVVARAGARQLFHGPADAVVPAPTLRPVLTRLLTLAETGGLSRMGLFAVANLTRKCGVRNLDVDDTERARAQAVLRGGNAPREWLQLLETASLETADYQQEIVGESLPLGLLVEDA